MKVKMKMSDDDTDWRMIFGRRSFGAHMSGSSVPPRALKQTRKRTTSKAITRKSITKATRNIDGDRTETLAIRVAETNTPKKVTALTRRDHIDLMKIILRNFELDLDCISTVAQEAGIVVTGRELRRTYFTMTRIMTAVDECGIDVRGMRSGD